MLARAPLAFAGRLDPGAVDQKVQGTGARAQGIWTVSPLERRPKVLKSGTGQSRPASLSRLATSPVACRGASPNRACRA